MEEKNAEKYLRLIRKFAPILALAVMTASVMITTSILFGCGESSLPEQTTSETDVTASASSDWEASATTKSDADASASATVDADASASATVNKNKDKDDDDDDDDDEDDDMDDDVFESASDATAQASETYTLAAQTDSEPQQVSGQTESDPTKDHGVMGEGVGINPGRVVWAYDPDSVDWDGKGYWWNPSNFDTEKVGDMVENSLESLTGFDDEDKAWDALFRYNNNKRGKGDVGYKSGEKIAIKVNMNGVTDATGSTNCCFVSPVTLKALLDSLVGEGGVKPEDITVYDASRTIPQHMINYCSKGDTKGVNFCFYDKDGTGHDCVADKNVKVIWSEKFEGDDCYFPTCVTEAEYMINLTSLKGHDLAGVTLSAKNHFGTIMNSSRNNPPQAAGIHGFVAAHDYNAGEGWKWSQRQMGTYTVLVDLLSNYQLGGKTVLYMLDAFFCSQSQGGQITLDCKWKQSPFNGDWTSSLFMSQDPVALDSVGVDFITNEPTINCLSNIIAKNTTLQNYLHEASQADNSPSGTVYYNGNGEKVGSLGTHEHWNNAEAKQYSRNLGKDEGIELIKAD